MGSLPAAAGVEMELAVPVDVPAGVSLETIMDVPGIARFAIPRGLAFPELAALSFAMLTAIAIRGRLALANSVVIEVVPGFKHVLLNFGNIGSLKYTSASDCFFSYHI